MLLWSQISAYMAPTQGRYVLFFTIPVVELSLHRPRDYQETLAVWGVLQIVYLKHSVSERSRRV